VRTFDLPGSRARKAYYCLLIGALTKLRHSVDSIYLSVSLFFYTSYISMLPTQLGVCYHPRLRMECDPGASPVPVVDMGLSRRELLLDFVTHPGASGRFARLIDLLLYADCHPYVYHLEHYGFGCYLPDLLSGMCFRGFATTRPRSDKQLFRGFDPFRTRKYAH